MKSVDEIQKEIQASEPEYVIEQCRDADGEPDAQHQCGGEKIQATQGDDSRQ